MPVTWNSILQVTIFMIIVLLITKPLGLYLTKVFAGERTWLSPVCVPIERFFYRLSGVNPEEEQKWTGYMIAVLVFSVEASTMLSTSSVRKKISKPGPKSGARCCGGAPRPSGPGRTCQPSGWRSPCASRPSGGRERGLSSS